MSGELPHRGAPRPAGRPGHTAGPRFDLRFEAGAGVLRLSKAIDAGPFQLSALSLGLGRVHFPVDVTAGAAAFRHRRTRVRAASFAMEGRDLVRAARARGVTLMLGDSSAEGVLTVGLADEFGAIALTVACYVDDRDLCFAVHEIRSVSDGPANPLRRVVDLASRLGLGLDEERGVFRLLHPARRMLASALCTWGYRLPDDRSADLGPPRKLDGRFVLDLGAPADAAEASLATAEDARFAAPVLARLAADDVEGAADAAVVLLQHVGRRHGAETALRERAEALALLVDAERPGRETALLETLAMRTDAFSAATRLRLAIRTDDGAAAATAAQDLARVEPLSELVAEAVSTVAATLSRSAPDAALELVRRAAARRPGDVHLALERVDLARRVGNADEIDRAAKKALGSALSSRDRAAVASAAARAFERLDLRRDAERLYREALFAAPDDPAALSGLAGLFAARGDRAAAVLRLDRAARAHAELSEPAAAAVTLRRAAELLRRAGRPTAAEERLVRALRHAPSDSAIICELARLRASIGDADGGGAAYDRLLVLEGHGGETLTHALVEAACFYLDDIEDAEGARPFVEMLARRVPEDRRLVPLQHRIERGDRTVPGTSAPPPPTEGRRTLVDHEAPDPSIDVHAQTQVADADAVERDLLEPTDPDALASLESSEADPVRRASLARALSNSLRRRGEDGEAARALGRAGVLDRDLAAIRAALALAERADDAGAVRAVVDGALEIVGEGPARDALLRRRGRFEGEE